MSTLSRAARLYLLHTALLTFGLALSAIFFNLVLVGLGYDTRTLRIAPLGELSLLGLLNSAPVLAGVLSGLPLWWLVDRVGLRSALLLATVLAAIPPLSLALWPEPLPLLLGTACGGPAGVLLQLSAAPLMMRASDEASRDTLFSLSFGINIAVAGLGTLAGGLLAGLLASMLGLAAQSAGAYRAVFGVSALLTLAAAAPLLALRAPPPADGAGTEAGVRPIELLRRLRARPWPVLRLMIAPLLISCGAALLIPYLSLYFRLRYSAPDAILGLVFAAVGVATGGAKSVAPRLSARLGRLPSVVLTQALAIPCLLLLGLAPTLWLAAALALVRGALMNMATPLYQAYVMEQTPEAGRPAVSGLLGAAYSAAYIVGPTISAEVQRRAGFGPIFIATAICYCLAAITIWALFVRQGAGGRRQEAGGGV